MSKTAERCLIALGLKGTCIVLASDTPLIRFDCENISDNGNDIGLDLTHGLDEPGLYVWTGEGEWQPEETWHCGVSEAYVEYRGTVRLVALCDLELLAIMDASRQVDMKEAAEEDDSEGIAPADDGFDELRPRPLW